MLILHKLSEVFEIADTVSVLRDGALTLSPTSVSQLSERQLSDEMIGPRELADRPAVVERLAAPAPSHRPKIELCSVTSTDNGTEPPLQDVSLVVGEGRIVGIAGVEGNGQRRLRTSSPGSSRSSSVTCGSMAVTSRTTPPHFAVEPDFAWCRSIATSRGRARRAASGKTLRCGRSWRARVRGSRRRGPAWPARRSTSGVCGTGPPTSSPGTSQAETSNGSSWPGELSSEATALIAAHPTRGLDFMATGFVRAVLRGLADAGAGVLLISSDLDELFEMADELVVFRGGRLVASFVRPYDRTTVGDAMLGVGSR